VISVSALFGLTAAFLFALAAALQQKGSLGLPKISLGDPTSLLRLAAQRTWLLGTGALLLGYVFQAAALDRGRLSIVEPLLVTTVVFALPLGHFLTGQHVGRKEVIGAGVILLGLAAFTVYGDPAGGRSNAPNDEWALTIGLLLAVCLVLMSLARGRSPVGRAALYGTVAGVLFGLSASLAKPTLEMLHEGLDVVLSHWQVYALLLLGGLAFVVQQVSLSTGHLAPSVATVSVANPVVCILIGVLLLEERLSRPAWHVVVAVTGLLLALGGAVVIALRRDVDREASPRDASPDQPATEAAPST